MKKVLLALGLGVVMFAASACSNKEDDGKDAAKKYCDCLTAAGEDVAASLACIEAAAADAQKAAGDSDFAKGWTNGLSGCSAYTQQ